LIVKTGGARAPKPTGESIIDDQDHIWRDDYLYMNGGAIFNFTLDTVPEMIQALLTKNVMTSSDIDFYVFHQANAFMLNALRKIARIPKEKFFIHLEDTGNTVSSTVFIGLRDAMDLHSIKPGMKVMIAGFGVGLSWGGTILTFSE